MHAKRIVIFVQQFHSIQDYLSYHIMHGRKSITYTEIM